jgi:hypothetical protein
MMLARQLTERLTGADLENDVLLILEDAVQRLDEANRLAQLSSPITPIRQITGNKRLSSAG